MASLLTMLAISSITATLYKPQPHLSPIARAFFEEAKTGLTAGFPIGLDEGFYATLHGKNVTYRHVDGGSSDNSLAPGIDTGTFTFIDGKLALSRDGVEGSLLLELHEAPSELRAKGVKYLLQGQGLLIGYAPMPLPAQR